MTVPRVNFSRTLKALGALPDAAIARACERFQEEGFLVLDEIVTPRYVKQLREHFVARYSRYLSGEAFPDAYHVGNRRTMVATEIEGPFNSSRVYANRFAYPIISRLLGFNAIMGAFNVVTSMPHSRLQHLHADHPGLFNDNAVNDS